MPVDTLQCNYGGGDATKAAFWGKYQKEIWVERGANAGKIMITGFPGHDYLYMNKLQKFPEKVLRSIYRKLNIRPSKRIILFLSQPMARTDLCTEEDQRNLTELIVRTASEFDDYILVIKLHPKELFDDYFYLKDHPLKDKFRIVKDIDLFEIINVSEIVISQWSTTSLDSILLDKPLIMINLMGQRDPLPFAEDGAAIGVYKKNHLSSAINKALNDESAKKLLRINQKKTIYEQTYKFDGRSTERVINLMFKMIDENKGG
jgi:CDP-glycerol glycerophosphotransferase (TagB/SpsB family)